MNNAKYLFVIFLLTCMVIQLTAATHYCNEPLTANGKTITLSCELVSGQYVMTFNASGSDYFSVPTYWHVGGVNWASYVTSGAGTAAMVITLPSNPNLGSNGVSWYMNGNTSSAYTVYGYQMPSGGPTWEGACTPADSENPVLTSATASNIANTQADIRVVATDNTGITQVVIKNGSTTLRTANITSTTSLNQAFTVTGLTKNTSYTLTVYVYDAAGNSASTTVSFTTTNTLEPTINAASESSKTSSRIVLNVTATDANKYKVIERNGLFSDKELTVISGTALNGQIAITGLSGSTTYNLRVYAMYNNTISANYIDLTITTPLGSQCSGIRAATAGSYPSLEYEIMYDGTNVNFEVQSHTSDPLQICDIKWALSTSESTTNTTPAPVTDGVAIGAITGRTAGQILYIYFSYKTSSMGSPTNTANGTYWSSNSSYLIYYVVGDCTPDADVPYMKSATMASATTSSITLDVSAVVNSGANTVTQFLVSTDGGSSYTTYTATGGQITITGLSSDSEYTFTVKALYNGNESENSKSVTCKTNKVSECEGIRGHFAYDAATKEANERIDFEIDYNSATNEVTITATSHSGTTLDFLQIEWYVPNYRTVQASSNNGLVSISGATGTYTFEAVDNSSNSLAGKVMGLLMLYSTTDMGGNFQTCAGLSLDNDDIIYYVVGECGCAVDDGDIPAMGNVSVASKTASTVTLNVTATDPSSIVSTYVIGGQKYNAVDGKITITGLSSCTTYNWDVYAQDPSCNVSSNSASVSVTTTEAGYNYAAASAGATAEFVFNSNTGYTGTQTIDGNLNTRGGTQYATPMTALEGAVLTVDMQQVRTVSEIDIFWERACATDYELQASVDGTHWATISRYTSIPVYTVDADPRTRGTSNMVYSFYPLPARYLRVKPNTLYIASEWGMSIFEFEAYNNSDECHEERQCPVMLGVRNVLNTSQQAIISVAAIDQQTPNPANLTYEVTVVSEVNGRTLTSIYTFEPGDPYRNDLSETTRLTIQGLVPGTNYTFEVKALDPNGNYSCNSNSVSIRTGKAEGCTVVREGNDAIVEGDWKAFPTGMTYTLELENNDEGTEFTADLSFSGKPAEMTISTVYFAIQKQTTGTDCYAGWIEVAMNNNGDGTFSGTFSESTTYSRRGQSACGENDNTTYNFPLFPNWPEINIYFKMETNRGIIHTDYFSYNAAETTCEELFVIFHDGSEPEDDMKTEFAGGLVSNEIYYYRLLTPGQWTPLCLPFTVDEVRVYDPDEKQYYALLPQRKSGSTTTKGNYWIRQQVENVSGASFKDSWFDGSDELPQKNVAYNLRVPSGDYYQNKYLIFHGVAGQTVASSFTLGTPSSSNDQYTLFGNNTMQAVALTKAYKEDADGFYYRIAENWTLKPFECYVLANTETMNRMRTIGRWKEDVATADAALENETSVADEIRVVNAFGMTMAVYYRCSFFDAYQQACRDLPEGYYLFYTNEKVSPAILLYR